MTALGRYAKLEAVARYLDGRSPRAREVVLSFGERSLVIMGLDDRPIAHWPLASLRALGAPAERPLELVPDPASDERLLLDDAEMSEAIAAVCPRLHAAAAPRRRKRRAWLRAAGLVALGALAVLALRPALPGSLVDLVPPEREEALGEALLARLPWQAEAGSAPGSAPGECVADEGSAALRALAARLAPALDSALPLRVSVLDHPAVDALALPGGRIVLLRGLIDAARAPDEVAAVLAHAAGHAAGRAPLRAVLERAGAGAKAGVLFGDITGASVLAAAVPAVVDRAHGPEAEFAADEAAFAILAAAGLPSRALAEFAGRLQARGTDEPPRWLAAHPWSAARDRRARAADTVGAGPFRPALGDRDWIALGNICDRTAALRR